LLSARYISNLAKCMPLVQILSSNSWISWLVWCNSHTNHQVLNWPLQLIQQQAVSWVSGRESLWSMHTNQAEADSLDENVMNLWHDENVINI
jgi:hypothetical protein